MSFEAGTGWTCGPEEAGLRFDLFIGARAADTSRSRVQKWIEAGCFLVNGIPGKKNHTMAEGDVVIVLAAPAPDESSTLKPEDIPLSIAYEDDDLLVVDKPKGMVTHPGNGIHSGTLANALAFKFKTLSDVNGPLRPGILHRLDKDTSGLLVVAKNNAAHLHLAHQLEAREIKRIYHALCWRESAETSGLVDQAIARNPRDPLKMGVHADGKRAVTHFRTIGFYQFATYFELELETGRTHQIRVHMAHIQHPVVGDPLYGGRLAYLDRVQPIYHPFATKLLSYFASQALHAHRLTFTHPVSGKKMEFKSPLPPEFLQALAFLERFKREI
ncbi:MAG: pseudouridine synthase, RluA family [Fibrobacteres bacterium]|nr:pseudouridine synthase, RluA family [Fibrobacterota bacterium]